MHPSAPEPNYCDEDLSAAINPALHFLVSRFGGLPPRPRCTRVCEVPHGDLETDPQERFQKKCVFSVRKGFNLAYARNILADDRNGDVWYTDRTYNGARSTIRTSSPKKVGSVLW